VAGVPAGWGASGSHPDQQEKEQLLPHKSSRDIRLCGGAERDCRINLLKPATNYLLNFKVDIIVSKISSSVLSVGL
jgi:hypothetical protein